MNNNKIKIYVSTLGCKVNQCDSAGMEESLRSCGYEIVPSSKKADVYIVNTCVVTKKTESQSRQVLRKIFKVFSGLSGYRCWLLRAEIC